MDALSLDEPFLLRTEELAMSLEGFLSSEASIRLLMNFVLHTVYVQIKDERPISHLSWLLNSEAPKDKGLRIRKSRIANSQAP